MKFDDIKNELEPFATLIETIPCEQLQGIKVARLILSKTKDLCQDLAVASERIAYLETELFGKCKNKEDETIKHDSENQEQNRGDKGADKAAEKNAEREAKKRLEQSKGSEKPKPKGSPKPQKIRRRVPKGLKCKHCQTEVKDLGLRHKASELDIQRLGLIDKEYLLHGGTCSCGEVQLTMPRPDRVLERRPYSAEFIAQLIVSKFKFHLPVYRQQKQFLDAGVYINRSVMNDIVNESWVMLEAVVKALKKAARQENYRSCDETPICRVKGNMSLRNYLWCLYTKSAIVFELTEKRNQKLAKQFIGKGGAIMTDGLAIYGSKSIDGKHGNCLAHCLQYFFRSYSSFPKESEDVINFLIAVYDVERLAKEQNLEAEGRRELRQAKSKIIMASLKKYLEQLNPPPRSSLGKAIKYSLERWSELTLFLEDGGLEVDNNRVESLFRDVKLGLKNFLFVQSDLGGEALAGFYSIIMTCELHGINPQDYIADVLKRIAAGHPNAKLEELLPWNWTPQEEKLKLISGEEYQEQDYPLELLISKLGLEGKVIIDHDHVNVENHPEELLNSPGAPPN
tara:strand:- start:96 stop:1799 length:1704 start_codon:yes stop_codon:yes gene_type:complete